MLAVDVHSGNTQPVLAVHGVSSNRRLWDWVPAQWPELSLIAPDLRGRGESVAVGEPYALHQHTEDLNRVPSGAWIANSAPAYSPEVVAAFQAALPCLAEPVRVAGVDHAALVMTDHGAAAVADVLRHVLD